MDVITFGAGMNSHFTSSGAAAAATGGNLISNGWYFLLSRAGSVSASRTLATSPVGWSAETSRE